MPAPLGAKSRRSITVDGVPGSSPPSSTRSAPSRRLERHLGERARIRAARRCWRWTASPARRSSTARARGSGRRGTRRPSVAGSICRPREARRAICQQHRHRAGQQRLQREALGVGQLAQRLQRGLEREEHDRGRPSRRTALELVHALRGRCVVGIAAHAVDGVGGEHGDAAAGDALAQAPRVLADRSRRSSRALPRRPARSPPGRALRDATPKPAARVSSPTAGRLSGAHLQRDRPHAGALGEEREQRAYQRQTVRDRRTARRAARGGGSRAPAAPAGARRRRAGWRAPRRTRRARPPAGRRAASAPPGRGDDRFERASSSASSLTSLPAIDEVRALVLQRERHRAAARADVEHAQRRRAAPARSRPAARSPAAARARGDRRPDPGAGSRGARRCRRPARAPRPAGAPRPERRAPPLPATTSSRSSSSRSRATPSTCASSSSASSRGVSQPAAAIAVIARRRARRARACPAS